MIIIKRVIFLLCSLVVLIFAKDDFVFGYVDENLEQISQEDKNIVAEGFRTLNDIKKLFKDGETQKALYQLENFKMKTNIEFLRSDIALLEAEIRLKSSSKESIQKGEELLEDAINKAFINEDDLPKAYMTLIDLKLALNKDEEAKYFIDTLMNNFNNDIIKAYGSIYLSKLYVKEQNYKRAINSLYKILAETENLEVATMIAYELFDVYILDNQREEAYKLMKQVLGTDVANYANNPEIVMKRINKLVKNGMYDLSVNTLKDVLKNTTNLEAMAEYKFQLANTLMQMYKKGDDLLLQEAQELFVQVLNDFPKGEQSKEAKMIIDEILMRRGKLEPATVNSKYPESLDMMQKVLLQEILNHIDRKEYETILKSKTVYKKIPNRIFNRFGYKNLDEILNQVRLLILEEYILNNRCQELENVLDISMQQALKDIIYNSKLQYAYFECLLENPNEKNYTITKNALFNARDSQTYLYLEQLALSLGKYKEALEFSNKVDMLKDEDFLKKEFLIRFQIVSNLKNPVEMKKFLVYASKNPIYIEANENNPVILDFYYQYYYYLLNEKRDEEAIIVLQKLYEKQKLFKAFIYSPSVELELARYESKNKNYDEAIKYLQEGLENTRNIKNNDLAEIYFELAKFYELKNDTTLYNETLQKCKALDPETTTSLYKKMCDEM